MNEASIMQSLIKKCEKVMPGCVVFKHFDAVTEGIPDLSVTWNRRTCWVEGKFDLGALRPSQVLTLMRLARVSAIAIVRFGFDASGAGYTTIQHHPNDSNAEYYAGIDVSSVADSIRRQLEY